MTAKQLNIKNRTYYFYIIKALNFEVTATGFEPTTT